MLFHAMRLILRLQFGFVIVNEFLYLRGTRQTAFSAWQHIDRFDPVRGSISQWVRLTANAVVNRHLASVYKMRAVIVDNVDIDEIEVIDLRGRDMDRKSTRLNS